MEKKELPTRFIKSFWALKLNPSLTQPKHDSFSHFNDKLSQLTFINILTTT